MILIGRNLLHPAIQTFALAILDFEGWSEGSRSQRNNNPGNLKNAGQPGVIGIDDQNHAVFESFEAGFNALARQLKAAFYGTSKVYSPNDSLLFFFSKYCQANSRKYAEFVAARLGVDAHTTLRQILEKET